MQIKSERVIQVDEDRDLVEGEVDEVIDDREVSHDLLTKVRYERMTSIEGEG